MGKNDPPGLYLSAFLAPGDGFIMVTKYWFSMARIMLDGKHCFVMICMRRGSVLM